MSSKKKVAILCIISMLVFLCVGCGKKETTQAETITEEFSQQETVVEQVEEESEQLVEETVEEVTSETEEVAVDFMEERLTELGLQGICVVVWNDANGTEYIIKDGDSYEEQEGDRFFVCTPSIITKLNVSCNNGSSVGKPTDNYCEITLNDSVEEDKVKFVVNCKTGEESTINFCLLPSIEQSGIDWVTSLGYDSPKMVVYNDTTGLRKELEEGEEYQLSEGDVVAMYKPDHWYFESTNITDAKIEHGVNIIIFDWRNLTLSDKLDVEISVWDTTTDSIVALHVTLLPPTE